MGDLLINKELQNFTSKAREVLNQYKELDCIEYYGRIAKLKYDQKKMTVRYNNMYYTIPILEIKSRDKNVYLDRAFYENQVYGSKTYDKTNNEELNQAYEKIDKLSADSDSRINHIIHALEKRFNYSTYHYRNSLTSIKNQLQLPVETKEHQIIQILIKRYNDILQSSDKQLEIFEGYGVLLTKKIADLYTTLLLKFFEYRLSLLNPNAENSTIEKKQAPVELEIPKGLSFKNLVSSKTNLDIRQTAILLHLLRKHGGILNLSDQSLASIGHYLTNHSEQNLRTKKGFGSIWDIMSESRQGEEHYSLKELKKFLYTLIEDIDNEIK